MRWQELTEDMKRLVEAGLARLHQHLAAGGALGVIAAARLDRPEAENEAAYQRLVRRTREHGYGPIQALGRSAWGPEPSLIIPHARVADLKTIGNEFGQEAVIHVPAGGKKDAVLYFLDAAGDQAGTSEVIGPTHFDTPNRHGITILKGLGYSPKDGQPTRSFTFGHKNTVGLIERLTVPPLPPLHPNERTYR